MGVDDDIIGLCGKEMWVGLRVYVVLYAVMSRGEVCGMYWVLYY